MQEEDLLCEGCYDGIYLFIFWFHVKQLITNQVG